MKIHKGDTVQVMTGKDRGRQGKVEKVFVKEGEVLILGINQYKKHRKPQGEGRPGEIVTLDRPMDASKLAVVCPKCKLPTRVGYRILDGKKTRICRKCKEEIEVKAIKLSSGKKKGKK